MLAGRLRPRSWLPAADSRCATLLQRLAMNTLGPTTNQQIHYNPNTYKGEVFFCLSCKRKSDFVRGIAGPELEELQCVPPSCGRTRPIV